MARDRRKEQRRVKVNPPPGNEGRRFDDAGGIMVREATKLLKEWIVSVSRGQPSGGIDWVRREIAYQLDQGTFDLTKEGVRQVFAEVPRYRGFRKLA